LGVGLALAQGLPPNAKGPFPRPYTHFSRQEPLRLVVADFARVQGYRAEISRAVEGFVNGRFEKVEPLAFLEGLEAAYGLRWYLEDQTLYFYHESENGQIILQPRNLSPSQLYDQLRATGAFLPHLPQAPPRGGGPLILTGPPAYLERLRETAATLDQTRPSKMVMRVFRLQHASADDQVVSSLGRTMTIPGVATILRGMVLGPGGGPVGTQVVQERPTVEKLKGTGLRSQGQEENSEPAPASPDGPLSIMADPRVNAVVIQDLAERMPYYEQVIADLDQEVHLVEIHAAIVDIDTDFKRDLGIVWQGSGGSGSSDRWRVGGEISADNQAFPVQPIPGDPTGGGLVMSTIYTQGARFFLSRIQALEKDGEARMLGRPSVLTADNQEATLENITTYYIPLTGEREVDLFKVETGTVLRVTPHIIEKHGRPPSVRLSVTIQDDQGAPNDGGTPGLTNAMPPIKQTKINTQAVIEAGQSLLIGGYYYEEKTKNEAGVPGLMRVPVIGNLFKNTGKGTRRMERLVLITPRVVRLGEVNNPPDFIDEPSFLRSPTQADYQHREPAVSSGGGCRRR